MPLTIILFNYAQSTSNENSTPYAPLKDGNYERGVISGSGSPNSSVRRDASVRRDDAEHSRSDLGRNGEQARAPPLPSVPVQRRADAASPPQPAQPPPRGAATYSDSAGIERARPPPLPLIRVPRGTMSASSSATSVGTGAPQARAPTGTLSASSSVVSIDGDIAAAQAAGGQAIRMKRVPVASAEVPVPARRYGGALNDADSYAETRSGGSSPRGASSRSGGTSPRGASPRVAAHAMSSATSSYSSEHDAHAPPPRTGVSRYGVDGDGDDERRTRAPSPRGALPKGAR